MGGVRGCFLNILKPKINDLWFIQLLFSFVHCSHNRCSRTCCLLASKKWTMREFPGPVFQTMSFHCRRHGFDSLVRELRSCMPHGMAKRKKDNECRIPYQKVVKVLGWKDRHLLLCGKSFVETDQAVRPWHPHSRPSLYCFFPGPWGTLCELVTDQSSWLELFLFLVIGKKKQKTHDNSFTINQFFLG